MWLPSFVGKSPYARLLHNRRNVVFVKFQTLDSHAQLSNSKGLSVVAHVIDDPLSILLLPAKHCELKLRRQPLYPGSRIISSEALLNLAVFSGELFLDDL